MMNRTGLYLLARKLPSLWLYCTFCLLCKSIAQLFSYFYCLKCPCIFALYISSLFAYSKCAIILYSLLYVFQSSKTPQKGFHTSRKQRFFKSKVTFRASCSVSHLLERTRAHYSSSFPHNPFQDLLQSKISQAMSWTESLEFSFG